MDRQEAIKVLIKGGRRSDVKDVMERANKRASDEFARIRNDRTRTDEYKRWSLAIASRQVRNSVDQQLEQMASQVANADRRDAEKVFGVTDLKGDPASLVISRRDAGDRVASINNPKELRDLLSRATRSGDEVLARAVAERALEMQHADTLHQFLADRPHLDDAVERLWNSERTDTNAFELTMQLTGLKPAELSGMSFGSIDALADAGEPQPAVTGSN